MRPRVALATILACFCLDGCASEAGQDVGRDSTDAATKADGPLTDLVRPAELELMLEAQVRDLDGDGGAKADARPADVDAGSDSAPEAKSEAKSEAVWEVRAEALSEALSEALWEVDCQADAEWWSDPQVEVDAEPDSQSDWDSAADWDSGVPACVADPGLCDDGNPCTDDLYTPSGGCEHPPNAAPCDDQEACTVADACLAGECVGFLLPCDCQEDVHCWALEDGDVCNGTLVCDKGKLPYLCKVDPGTVVACPGPAGAAGICLQSHCDPATGECSFLPAHEGFICDDGAPCSVNDKCSGGMCTPGISLSCDDGNVCTEDSCVGGQCLHEAGQADCDDANACTQADHCEKGTCVGGENLDCDDGNPCTTDQCAFQVGCWYGVNNNPCSDGDPCTVSDTCHLGSCAKGVPLDCDDGNECTDDSCAPPAGCKHAPNQADCDDANLCTTGDHCSGGKCLPAAAPSCDDGNPCTTDSCQPGVGCIHTANAAPCEDGNVCTSPDKCSGGECVAGPPANCSDGNPCTEDSCDAEAGCAYAATSAACEDGDVCTVGDSCSAGQCIPGGTVSCNDQNPCTDDSCQAHYGCVFQVNLAGCDDGNACTLGDGCQEGKCLPGAKVNCDDANPCTDDSCDQAAGCTHVLNTKPCDDGNKCTEADVCSAGQCKGMSVVVCDDQNKCTDDSCDKLVGCVFAPNTLGCSDGNGCTMQDKCSQGACKGIPCEQLGKFCVGGVCKDTPCTGTFFGGYCWHQGTVDSSCNSICGPFGGCVEAGLHVWAGQSGCQVCQQFHPGAACQEHGDCGCAAVYPGWYTGGSTWCGYNNSDCTTCATAKACGSYSVQRYCPCTN